MPKKKSVSRNSSKNCNGWCPPTMIYLTLSVVTTLLSLFGVTKHDELYNGSQNKIMYIASHGLGIIFWTSILYWLCSNCYYRASWAVLLTPIVLAFFVSFAVLGGMIGGKLKVPRKVKEDMTNGEIDPVSKVGLMHLHSNLASKLGAKSVVLKFIRDARNYLYNRDKPKPKIITNEQIMLELDYVEDMTPMDRSKYTTQIVNIRTRVTDKHRIDANSNSRNKNKAMHLVNQISKHRSKHRPDY